MRRIVYGILLSCVFLLALSALVVTPEAPVQPQPAHAPEELHAVFHPLVSVILPEAVEVPGNRTQMRLVIFALPLLGLCGAPFICKRDANGRVLTARRYENSVYQLFRPETAGG